MFRLVATDLDGTLLRSDKTISKETEEFLSSLYEKDIFFVPTTGRSHRELPDPVRRIEHLRYAITCNGGGVYDFDEQRYIYNFTIDKELAERVLRYSESLPVYPSFVCDGKRYVLTEADGKISDYVLRRAAAGVLDLAQPSRNLFATLQEMTSGLQKIFLYSKDDDLTPGIIARLKEEFPELFITTSGPIFIEINAAGIDKGKTLRLLCEHLNIPIEESVAFGDAANDLAMLKAAGCAVVPANGTDEAKALADLNCESCDDDGVRKALERLISQDGYGEAGRNMV